ncbi:metal ABC transporter ATP-binding protein [Spongiactinospora sp. TRM90649]|uniref:metal ABC transporter ATP-binding protein n=1 Tax=Spongiactinospora sp. TRM90649 TaxID=3031114 RepID=UPI0023F6A47B|nr:metal ABC transporter ATP-binding protein [Spongiactinospora sp. TRM90649]MDF5754154.1 metal ABC transporter ATP-binding protein [Spongiactinospora sp. TRM90649]
MTRQPGVETVFAMTGGQVSLDGRPVLRGVDVQVRAGEVVAVLGANGSGKSTLIRALLGLVPLSAGRTELYGVPPARFRAWHRVGYVPQRLSAGGGVPSTIREVVASGRIARQRRLRPTSIADRDAVDRALHAVGLADRAGDPVHALSGGQQQRVLIARALAGEPEVFVMDEPTAGVDADSQRNLAETLSRLIAEGRTVLLVAHELGPMESLVTRALVLKDGVIVHDGAPPAAVGTHALPGHDHVHPHAAPAESGPLRWHPGSAQAGDAPAD